MISIRIEYGTRHITTEVAEGSTVDQVINNPNFKAILMYDRVTAYVNGVSAPGTQVLEDGDVLKLQAAAQTKN
jgi:hypothetical protein